MITTPTTPDALPGLRRSTDNPNHHLWNNHGTWFLHYTTHPTPFTKERIRRSLGTKSLETARERRDVFFAQLSRELTLREQSALAVFEPALPHGFDLDSEQEKAA
ncbi:hypothetical protein [Cephaloticoccus primus]|uniref:hypothetical protein n=1 Tax=Cephaloticoccus primus TaxID=1548207 RepID=UPI000839810B|nr:hypothetical protein [Cephaloticoccus primus]